MKHLLVASGILLVIMTASLLNIRYINALTEDITELIKQSESLQQQGKASEAAKPLRTALDRWENERLIRIVLAQSDIDEITDGLYELLRQADTSSGTEKLCYEQVLNRIQELAENESLRWDSVF